MKVATIHTESLLDIPAQLRKLAGQIERGESGEVATLFLIMPVADDFPVLVGWGEETRPADFVFQMELARHWLSQNLVERVKK